MAFILLIIAFIAIVGLICWFILWCLAGFHDSVADAAADKLEQRQRNRNRNY